MRTATKGCIVITRKGTLLKDREDFVLVFRDEDEALTYLDDHFILHSKIEPLARAKVRRRRS